MKTGCHSEHAWSKTVRVRKVTNNSVIFPALNVVRCGNVELPTLNIALLGRQPKYCEITFSFELAVFLIFLLLFGLLFILELLLLFVFNVFVSLSGILKGASIATEGFTC